MDEYTSLFLVNAFYKNVVSIIDGKKSNPSKARDTLSNLYTNETNELLELEINIRTSPYTYEKGINTPKFEYNTFISTLKGLWSARLKDIEQSIEFNIVRKTITGIQRIDPIRITDTLVSNGPSYIRSRTVRMSISPMDDMLREYGYLPSLTISAEEEIPDKLEYNTVYVEIAMSFQIDTNWKVKVSMLYEPSVTNFEQKVISYMKLWEGNNTIDDYISTISDNSDIFMKYAIGELYIDMLYLPMNGSKLPIFTDINSALTTLVKTGYMKEHAKLKFDKVVLIRRKELLWKYMGPITSKDNPERSKGAKKLLDNNMLKFDQIVPMAKTADISVLSNIYNNIDRIPYYLAPILKSQRVILVIDIDYRPSSVSIVDIWGSMVVYAFAIDFLSVSPTRNISKDEALDMVKQGVIGDTANRYISMFDGEFIDNTYNLYSCPMFVGEMLVKQNITSRIKVFDTVTFTYMVDMLSKMEFNIRHCPYAKLTKDNFSHEMSIAFNEAYGATLVNGEESYFGSNIYKFKPIEHQTVDLLLKRLDVKDLSAMGISSKGVEFAYMCYVSSNVSIKKSSTNHLIRSNPWQLIHFPNIDSSRIPVPFATSIAPNSHVLLSNDQGDLDDKIYECRWQADVLHPEEGHWVPVELNSNKTSEYKSGLSNYGNFYTTVLTTLNANFYPITCIEHPEMLSRYAVKKVPISIKSLNIDVIDALNVGKAILYETHVKTAIKNESILDFGDGSDFDRLFFTGARNVFVVSHDLRLLRDYDQKVSNWIRNPSKSGSNTIANLISDQRVIPDPLVLNLKLIHHDITTETVGRVMEILYSDPNYPRSNLNAIVVPFGIQRLLGNPEHLIRFYELCNRSLSKNGVVVMTFIDGNALFHMMQKPLKQKNQYEVDNFGRYKLFYDFRSPIAGQVKFSFEPLYDITSAKPPLFGGKVKMYTPMIDTDPFIENLVSSSVIKQHFKGFKCIIDDKLIDQPEFSSKFCTTRKRVGMSATDILCSVDIMYLSLIKVLVLSKK